MYQIGDRWRVGRGCTSLAEALEVLEAEEAEFFDGYLVEPPMLGYREKCSLRI